MSTKLICDGCNQKIDFETEYFEVSVELAAHFEAGDFHISCQATFQAKLAKYLDSGADNITINRRNW